MNAYNGLDSSRYAQRRYAQASNAFVNIARSMGVPKKQLDPYMRTDMQSGRNKVSKRKVSGFNVAYRGSSEGK